jgi:hypothetical protein
MASVDNKRIREQCNVMNDAWFEGAPSAKFNGWKRSYGVRNKR